MLSPDNRLFEADLQSAEFRDGEACRKWGKAEPDVIPNDDKAKAWPNVFLWIAAAPRANSPNRFHIALDAAGYRTVPPTGTFWDPAKKARLDFTAFPKGKSGSRFAMVFRTNWGESKRAFYHPYDRVAAQSHANWAKELPHLVWTDAHTIVNYLEEFHGLLNGGDYLGV